MSSKASLKVLMPEGQDGTLFRWVAELTGSKNALKGVGYFLGGFLLACVGFRGALWAMAGALVLLLASLMLSLRVMLGKAKNSPKFVGIFSKSRDVNVLSAALLPLRPLTSCGQERAS